MRHSNGGGGNYDEPFRPRLSLADAAARLHGEIGRDAQGRDVIRCPGPGHNLKDRSLAVWLDDDEPGGLGVFSFSDKDQGDALGLKDWVRDQLGFPAFKPGKPNGKGKGDGFDADPIVARYEYQDADGLPVLLVNRTAHKKFLQQRWEGGGWVWGGIETAAKVPYRLAELLEALGKGQTVFVCEGEKSVDELTRRGFAATCSPGGAGKWVRGWGVKYFKGAADVIVLPDHDQPGQMHADKVAADLEGHAHSLRIIQLPGLAAGQDVWDYLKAGGSPEAIETMRPGPPPRGKRASELWDMVFPPIKYAIPPYISEGLFLLAGAPKRGKSWLALDLCCGVAFGGFTLDQKCEEGDVLYAALEDSPRRMKSRLQRVCAARDGPPSRLTIWFGTDLPRLGAGCEEALREWLTANPGARLVVIDTLNYIRPERTRDEDPYSYDYRSAVTLQRLAGEFGVAVVVIHHTRKSAADDYLESISGTNGLTGGSDAVIVLDRQGDGTTVFRGRGRDVEEFELAVKFDKETCRWSVLGDAAETHLSDVRRKILNHLREAGWFLTPSEIASQTGLTRNQVDQRLFQMLKAGDVVKAGRAKYGLPSAEIINLHGPDDDQD